MALRSKSLLQVEVIVQSCFLFAMWMATAQGAQLPAGTPVDGAINVDVTQYGLDLVGVFAPLLIPEEIPVEPIGEEYLGLLEQCWLGGYAFEVSNLKIYLDIVDISLTPNVGFLDVDIELEVQVNEIGDPFNMYTELECIPSNCSGRVETFNVTAQTQIRLDMEDGDDATSPPTLDATIGTLSIEHGLTGDAVHLDDCPIGTILDVLGFFGLDIIDLIIPAIDGALNDAVDEFGPELETAIEDAFNQLVIDEQFAVLDASLRITATPHDIQIVPEGIRISLTAMADAGVAAQCIEAYDPGGSVLTESNPPDLAATPAGLSPNYAAAGIIADDFGNQAMYALWRSGLLCFTVDDDLGFPIDTAVLGLLAGETFNILFPDPKPMIIQTLPKEAPLLVFDGNHDVGVSISDLGLDFIAELDHRQARVLALGLDIEAGADIEFDGGTGELAVNINLGTDALVANVTANEFVPNASGDIESSFAGVFSGLVGGLLGDTLSGLSFNIPAFEGIGLTQLEFAPTGTEEDWLGVYAWAGTVSYGDSGAGCGGCSGGDGGLGGCGAGGDTGLSDTGAGAGGCESSGGCDGGGCASARNQRRWGFMLIPFAFIALRRRDRHTGL